ncbi:hexokinase A, partial [Chytriomyces hyalinus]
MSNNDFTYGLATGIAICAGLFSLGAAFVYINNQRAKNAKAAAHASQPLALSSIAVSDDRASTSSFVPNETHKISPDEPNPATLVRLQHLFEVNGDKLSQIAKHMVAEMKKGLATDDSTLKMIPTHVVRRPKGDETGSYLALDLGGTNFRVCEVTLDGRGGTRVRQSKHT